MLIPMARLSRSGAEFDYAMSVGENTGDADHRVVLPQSGPVAQLGARFHGMEEVVGSIPTRSTKSLSHLVPIAPTAVDCLHGDASDDSTSADCLSANQD